MAENSQHCFIAAQLDKVSIHFSVEKQVDLTMNNEQSTINNHEN
jgi:hypothetical protein